MLSLVLLSYNENTLMMRRRRCLGETHAIHRLEPVACCLTRLNFQSRLDLQPGRRYCLINSCINLTFDIWANFGSGKFDQVSNAEFPQLSIFQLIFVHLAFWYLSVTFGTGGSEAWQCKFTPVCVCNRWIFVFDMRCHCQFTILHSV